MALTAVVVVLLAAAGIGETSRNAVADTLAEQGLLLGIDFSVGDSKAPHPTDERRKAYQRAGFGAWMTAQIEEGSDGIGEPPAAMTEYLAENRAAVWSTIAALEKGSPDWGAQPADQPPEALEEPCAPTPAPGGRSGRDARRQRDGCGTSARGFVVAGAPARRG